MSRPFATRDEAAYWGGGVVVAVPGGYICLGGHSTPSGPELYHVAASEPAIPGRNPGVSHPGWPESVRGRYVWATPDNGGASTVCAVT